MGPLRSELKPLVHTSPIGLVPKPHQEGKWRMIVDLSSPFHHSVNDGIWQELTSLSYAKVDEAVDIILHLGPGAELVKIDLKNAYRIVPIHPDDHHLLGIDWKGDTYVDRALPFGLRSAPKIFSAVADMITWALHCAGVPHLIHYLDDFLFVGEPNTEQGKRSLEIALQTLEYLGVPVAEHKTEGPATSVTFLGILIDTRNFQLRLPQEKIQRLRELIDRWQSIKVCKRKELQSFLGHLSHAASVVHPGRTFLRELFNLLSQAKSPHHHVRLNIKARADISWWRCLLHTWNGSSFFPPPDPSIHVYSDASGTYGSGAFVAGLGWFQTEWPEDWEGVDIASKELVPVVVAAALWGRQWSGSHVCFHFDNMAVVAVLNNRSAKNSLLAHLLRCFSLFSAYFAFHFTAVHIPGVLNTAADALSRDNLHLFSSLVPNTPQFLVPPPLSQLLITSRPDWGSPHWTQLFALSLREELPSQP